MEPPIHTEYLRSGGATTLIFIVDGANAVSSFVILSPPEHRRAARQDHIRVEVLTDIQVSLHDRLERRVVNAARLLANEGRLEQDLRATEALTANGDDVAIRPM